VASFFLDTSYHVAMIDRRDQLHCATLELAQRLDATDGAKFVTTDDVLAEFLTFMSKQGEAVRRGAVLYVQGLRRKPPVVIVRQSPRLFDEAFELYRARPDKSYSMTDCMSMMVCRERAITDVLTYDRDFEQEGFVALLRGA
jgi:predicted nucleic acid-binding protein